MLVILALGVFACYNWLGSLVVIAGFLLLVVTGMLNPSDDPMVKMATERPGESICTFTRQLEYRTLDPKVIRAVYEELADFCWCDTRKAFPLRPTDTLIAGLQIDEDDLTFSVVPNIAHRARRSLETLPDNPSAKVFTAGDLVTFFNAQPKLETA